jgi:hypothetical protein
MSVAVATPDASAENYADRHGAAAADSYSSADVYKNKPSVYTLRNRARSVRR